MDFDYIAYNRKKRNFFIVFLPLSYCFLGELKQFLYIHDALVPLAFLVAVIFLALERNKSESFFLTRYEMIWIIFFFSFVLFRNGNFKYGNYKDILYYGFVISFLTLSKYSHAWIYFFVKCIVGFGMFHALSTLAFYFSPTLFYKVVVPLLPYEDIFQVICWYKKGMMSGWTSHYSVNGIYLALSALVLTVCVFNKVRFSKYALLINVTALFLVGKRAHAVFYILSILFVFFLFYSDRPARRFIYFFVGILLSTFFLFMLAYFIPEIMTPFVRLLYETDDSAGGRTPLYIEAIRIFKEHPLFGVGWGGYRNIVQYTVGLHYSEKYARMMAHNVYLQVACETGIFGLSFFIYIVSYPLIKTYRLMRKLILRADLLEKKMFFFLAISLAIQIFFLLYCVTGNPLYDSATLFAYALAISIAQTIGFYISLSRGNDCAV